MNYRSTIENLYMRIIKAKETGRVLVIRQRSKQLLQPIVSQQEIYHANKTFPALLTFGGGEFPSNDDAVFGSVGKCIL